MGTMYEPRVMAVPEIHPEHKEYWEAAAEGKLLIKKCEACGEYHYYPRVHCPFCNSDQTKWVEAKGTGRVYTYSVMRRGVSYAIGFVTLDEGPRMMTNFVDCDLDTIAIDQKVKVVFKESGAGGEQGPLIPCFAPIKDE